MNNLELHNPLVLFDLETTGTNPIKDRIVEIAMIKLIPGAARKTWVQRINPTIPIPEEATAIHGITDQDVASEPTFKKIGAKIAEFIGTADLGGYNVFNFDVPLLVQEFSRAGIAFNTSGRAIIDAMKIFHMKEPRTLAAAYKFYCQKELVRGHSAEADIMATVEIIDNQISRYPDLPREPKKLGKLLFPDCVDLGGRFAWKNGQVVLTFGKYKGKSLQQLCKNDVDYLEWVLSSDFPENTKQIIRNALAGNFPKWSGDGKCR